MSLFPSPSLFVGASLLTFTVSTILEPSLGVVSGGEKGPSTAISGSVMTTSCCWWLGCGLLGTMSGERNLSTTFDLGDLGDLGDLEILGDFGDFGEGEGDFEDFPIHSTSSSSCLSNMCFKWVTFPAIRRFCMLLRWGLALETDKLEDVLVGPGLFFFDLSDTGLRVLGGTPCLAGSVEDEGLTTRLKGTGEVEGEREDSDSSVLTSMFKSDTRLAGSC